MTRFLVRLTLLAAMGAFLLTGCAVIGTPSPSRSPLARTSPLAHTSPLAGAGSLQLTVMHTNDTWGYLGPCG